MRGLLFLILLALAACAHQPAATVAPSSPNVALGNWRLASGKPPSGPEFAALVAACEDRGKGPASGSIDRCLADLGLKRTP